MAKNHKKVKKEKRPGRKDISIVQDIKEPFSWHRFWDEKIVANWIAFKGYLDKKGILYLMLSPFRYRARLIFRLWLIVICVLVGVVPRVLNLIQGAEQQYRSNEFVLVKNQVFPSSRFVVSPLLSSHKDNVHIMTFNIRGSADSGVSSSTADYDVRVTPNREVSKPNEITFRYQVIPFDANQRILVVELDLSKTTNTGGIYDVWVNAAGESNMDKPLQLTISKQQEEGPLYDGSVHLSALSTLMSGYGQKTDIKQAEEKLESQIQTYKLEYDRLKAMGTEVEITPEQIRSFADKSVLFKGVEDDSTTDTVTQAPPKTIITVEPPKTSVTISGKRITEEQYKSSNEDALKDIDPRMKSDIATAVEITAKVASAVNHLNNARSLKYTELYGLARTLSAPFKVDAYTEPKTVASVKSPLIEAATTEQ